MCSPSFPRSSVISQQQIHHHAVALHAADMGIELDTQDNSSLGIDAKMKLSKPKRDGSFRSYIAEVEYMGVVARGSYEKITTLTMTPQVGLKLEKDDYRKTPIFKAPPIKFAIAVGPIPVPVTIDLSATLGYNIQADIKAELELQQKTTTGLAMKAGIEYDGNQTKPIFDVTPVFKPEKPKIVSKQGTVTATSRPTCDWTCSSTLCLVLMLT